MYAASRARGEAPLGIARLFQGIRGGVARLSLRLVSTVCSAVLFAIVTFFVFSVSVGLIAFAVVSFFFSALHLVWGILAVLAVSRRQLLPLFSKHRSNLGPLGQIQDPILRCYIASAVSILEEEGRILGRRVLGRDGLVPTP